MKTDGMNHQKAALRRMSEQPYFALFMEQGTGKTWTLLADAERLYASGIIDALFVVAPKGVHTNWVRREIPAHMDVSNIARAWRSGAGQKEMKHLEELFIPRETGEIPPLRVLAMNVDALNTNAGFAFAKRFLNATKAMFVIDESSRIKNPATARSKAVHALRPMVRIARIATGTPITNAPVDVFNQMEFLHPGLLGTSSYRAFVAEYAVLLDIRHPMMAAIIKRNPNAARAQMVAKNADGTPQWRNLDKLQQLLAPHSFRVLKKDCLDLPDKIYKQVYFDMDSEQQRAYKLMDKEFRVLTEDGRELPVKALAALVKLQQITSGFVMKPNQEGLMYVSEKNPRLSALMDMTEDISGKFIVWARFKEELRAVSAALTAAGLKVVEYHGEVNTKDRELAVDRFQFGDADVFVGQPQSGGIGLTLTAADTVIYYSNDFNLETRLQSEDRAHRIGTRNNVVYIDLVAVDTIDEPIARALQRKANLAATILGDN